MLTNATSSANYNPPGGVVGNPGLTSPGSTSAQLESGPFVYDTRWELWDNGETPPNMVAYWTSQSPDRYALLSKSIRAHAPPWVVEQVRLRIQEWAERVDAEIRALEAVESDPETNKAFMAIYAERERVAEAQQLLAEEYDFEEAPYASCHRGRPLAMQSVSTGKWSVGRNYCGSMGCSDCFHKLKVLSAQKVNAIARGASHHYYYEIPTEEWGDTQRGLRYRNADGFSIPISATTRAVFSTIKIADHAGGEIVPTNELSKVVSDTLDAQGQAASDEQIPRRKPAFFGAYLVRSKIRNKLEAEAKERRKERRGVEYIGVLPYGLTITKIEQVAKTFDGAKVVEKMTSYGAVSWELEGCDDVTDEMIWGRCGYQHWSEIDRGLSFGLQPDYADEDPF